MEALRQIKPPYNLTEYVAGRMLNNRAAFRTQVKLRHIITQAAAASGKPPARGERLVASMPAVLSPSLLRHSAFRRGSLVK